MIAAAAAAENGLRIVGDVHGDSRAFAYAADTDRFVIQLGDLVDYGPDSIGVLRIMLALIEAGRGTFVLGNHDHRLARALLGQLSRVDGPLHDTLAQIDAAMRERVLAAIQAAPAWLRHKDKLFVHGGFHAQMLDEDAPPGIVRPEGPVARALYGQVIGGNAGEYPVRSHRWVDRIPSGLTVYAGHDRVSMDGRPLRRMGQLGGSAVFMDTGAGKGGHLSWVDLAA